MASTIKTLGALLSATFDPWQSGTDKAPATGIEEEGIDICNKYAPLKYGSKAAATGIKSKGVDLRDIFAARGTAIYKFAFDGGSYASHRARSEASITLYFFANGTWKVLLNWWPTGGVAAADASALASGSWKIYGGAASDYTVVFSSTGLMASGDVYAGDPNNPAHAELANTAGTQKALTADQYIQAGVAAVVVENTIAESGSMTARLYKNGVLINTSTCSINLSSVGF